MDNIINTLKNNCDILKIFLLLLIFLIIGYIYYEKTNKSKKIVKTDEILLDELMEQEKQESLKYLRKIKKSKRKNKYVYLKISIGNSEPTKIKIKLFDKIVPKTCENFRKLCKKKLYKNTIFHRIIQDFMIQGGDYENFDGTGGQSIYGNNFPDENFNLNHDRPYLLSMANSGPDTNGSQFFITTNKTPHLDGKHVVFGEVIITPESKNVLQKLNTTETNDNDNPRIKCAITDCGVC